MIVRPAQNPFRLLFVWHGSVLQAILPQLAIMTMVSVLAMHLHGRFFGEKIPLNATPLTLCGVALTIFLAFRNNASYERYREARRLWGHLLIAGRTLTSQMLSYAPRDPHRFDRRRFVALLIAVPYALKHQLRGTDAGADLSRLLGAASAAALGRRLHAPPVLLDEARRCAGRLNEAGALSDSQLWLVDGQLQTLGEVIGGCERIANTPLPFAYNVLLHRTVYAYCALLPFGLMDSTGFATPLVSVFVAYTLIALEAIASDISEPFGFAPNNLALDAMTRNIERSLLDLCGEPIPPETRPLGRYQLT